MRNAGQGGSVLGFILGGVLLTVLLVGSVYMIHQKGQAPANQQPSVPARQPAPAPDKPAPEPQKETTQEDTSSPSSFNPPASSRPQSQQQGTSSTPRLPQTGPGEALLSAFALALLSGALAAYIRSRRAPSL